MSEHSSTPRFKPLNSGNYHEWSGEMKAWLMKLGYWRLVNGKDLKPTKEELIGMWETKAEKAAGEIYLAVESDQRVHIKGVEEDPVQMWEKLQKAHLHKRPGTRFNAYDEFFSIRKEEDKTLTNLAMRIDKSMINIQNLRPADFKMETLDDELQCMAMIRALPEEYAHLSTSLLLMDKLDKDVILQAFKAEEMNRKRRVEIVDEKAAKAQQKKGYRHNGKPGGKPDDQMKEVTCYRCGEKGHIAMNCPSPTPKQENAKQADQAEKVVESAGNASLRVHDANGITNANFHWNTDTGATSHMTPHRDWVRNYKPYRVPIRLADHTIVYSEGLGTVMFRPTINGRTCRDVELTRVLHVPALQNNLLAVLHLTEQKQFKVHIRKGLMEFRRFGQLLFVASVNSHNTGYLNGEVLPAVEYVKLVTTLPVDLTLWHRRLGHHNYEGIKQLVRDDMVKGLVFDSKDNKPDPVCEPCLAGKMVARPFPSTDHRAEELLGLVHSDVHPVGVRSRSGFYYWVTFVDDNSRFRAAIPLKKKSDTFDAFKRFKAWAENQLGIKIKAFHEDKGGEYMSTEFQKFLDSCGIERQHTCRNRPQQNGVAERTNRVLSERITAMLEESGLPKQFWEDCLAAFMHVWNDCPTSALTKKTPFEVWHGSKPDFSHLRVWGCTAYVLEVEHRRVGEEHRVEDE